jgi:predicted tellurium resistance membrane protein TerC
MRVAFLASVVWLTKAKQPLFFVENFAVSTRDIVLGLGGAFLLYKGTVEIHAMTEGPEANERTVRHASFWGSIVQIMLLDLVFSIDSVITAVGMTQNLPVMIAAIFVAIIVMLVAAGALGRFIENHPTTKMLALAFLLLVGVALVADAAHFHIPREYLYFAIAFSALVESLNVTVLRRHVRRPQVRDEDRERV